jgi:type VI protein secretion system component Hcp
LFAAVAEGKHLQKVTIVQQDNNKDDVFSVTLEDVVIANYELGGDISQEVPSEKIAFNFAKVLITDTITGTKFGWDLKQGRTF